MARKDEIIEDVVDAFEESTGRVPNDYELAEIRAVAQEYVEGENDCR